jgi:hypothetical protein
MVTASSASSRTIYLTNYADNAILRRDGKGNFETLVHDPRVLWPDTLSLAEDGYLYFMANQLHRRAQFHGGKDPRKRPYGVFRAKVDAGPVVHEGRWDQGEDPGAAPGQGTEATGVAASSTAIELERSHR